MFLREFLSRLYSETNYIWLAKDLGCCEDAPPSAIHYSLQPATAETFKKLHDSLSRENGQSLFELLRRISFYEHGFDGCYVALTDSGDLCYLQWLLFPRHNNLIRAAYPRGMRELKEGEVMLENAFTFPQYRKKGIMPSVMNDLARIARSQGFSRMLTQVAEENTASLKGCYRAGFQALDEAHEVRLLFRIRIRNRTSSRNQPAVLERK